MRSFLGWGSLCCALAVVAGAFGAHGLAARLDARSMQLWETAARYLMYGGLGQGLVGLLAAGEVAAGSPGQAGGGWRGSGLLAAAGGALLAGTLLFSGTVAALALGGPRWLGAVTPLGGLLVIAGFLLLSWAGFRRGGNGLARVRAR
jgi:uncharacterized membrane protein YgdD (TMEM256/DUF423 family)